MLWSAISVLLCSATAGLHLQVRDFVCRIPESDTGMVCIWQLSLCAFVIFIVLYLLVVVEFIKLDSPVDVALKLIAQSSHVAVGVSVIGEVTRCDDRINKDTDDTG